MKNVSGKDFSALVADGVALIEFSSPTCAPCKALEPKLDALAALRPDVKFGKVDIFEDPNTAFNFHVRSVPTVLIFKNGGVFRQFVGSTDIKEIEAAL